MCVCVCVCVCVCACVFSQSSLLSVDMPLFSKYLVCSVVSSDLVYVVDVMNTYISYCYGVVVGLKIYVLIKRQYDS